jgi:predicted nucleic acid-binding protein
VVALRDPGDDFVIELAVASRAQFIVTHNVRDFVGAREYGIHVIRPHELLRILEKLT